MNRGSKHNPYQCPECSYATTRKYNLGIHMGRVHGLSLSPHLYTSQRDWAWAQRRALERAYIEEAETEKEEKKAYLRLYNFLIEWGEKGYWSILTALPQVWEARKRHDKEVAKSKDQ